MAAVLLIDDSLTATLSQPSALKQSGFPVARMHSGQDANGQVRQQPRFTPVLPRSADTSSESRQRARELGASGWLAKA